MIFFRQKLEEVITLPAPPKDDMKEALEVEEIIRVRTPEQVQSVRDHDQDPYFAIKKVVRENGLVCSVLGLLMPGPYVNVRCVARKVPVIAGSETVRVGTCRDYSRQEMRNGQMWTIGGRECLQKDGTWFAVF